jgi:hypothetical protein
VVEVDFHGHTVDEALRIFIDVYNRHVRSKSEESLRVIHGYGSASDGLDGGKIRRKIRTFLEGAADSLDWKPGEDLEGNPGVTIVFPRKILPTSQNQLAANILAFCSIPRTESKIAGEFRKNTALEIKATIRTLVRQGQLKVVPKGDRETYVTVA